MEHNLFDLLYEDDKCTHYPTNGNQPSVIDLTFASPEIYDSVQRWAIDETAATASDHTVIKFELHALEHTTVPDPISNRFNWKKADWDLFRSTLAAKAKQQSDKWTLAIAHSHHHQNLDWAANTLRDTILAAIQLSVPTTKPSPRSKVWWTQELTEKRKDMATMERRWKEAQTPLAKLRYKLSRNIYGRALQEAKTKCWDNFLAEAQGKEVYTAFRYTKPRRVQRTPVLKAGNQTATVFTEKARLFRNTLFPPPPEYTIVAETSIH